MFKTIDPETAVLCDQSATVMLFVSYVLEGRFDRQERASVNKCLNYTSAKDCGAKMRLHVKVC